MLARRRSSSRNSGFTAILSQGSELWETRVVLRRARGRVAVGGVRLTVSVLDRAAPLEGRWAKIRAFRELAQSTAQTSASVSVRAGGDGHGALQGAGRGGVAVQRVSNPVAVLRQGGGRGPKARREVLPQSCPVATAGQPKPAKASRARQRARGAISKARARGSASGPEQHLARGGLPKVRSQGLRLLHVPARPEKTRRLVSSLVAFYLRPRRLAALCTAALNAAKSSRAALRQGALARVRQRRGRSRRGRGGRKLLRSLDSRSAAATRTAQTQKAHMRARRLGERGAAAGAVPWRDKARVARESLPGARQLASRPPAPAADHERPSKL